MKRYVFFVGCLLLFVLSGAMALQIPGKAWLSGGSCNMSAGPGTSMASGITNSIHNFLPDGTRRTWFFFQAKSDQIVGLSLWINGSLVSSYKLTKLNIWQSVCAEFDPSLIPTDKFLYEVKILGGTAKGTVEFRKVGVAFDCQADPAERLYRIVLHGHSDHSDGTRTVKGMATKAKTEGFDGMILTDHYDMLFGLKKKTTNTAGSYISECDAESNESFLMASGVELCSVSYFEGEEQKSHMVAFPLTSSEPIEMISACDQQLGVIQRLSAACDLNKMVWGAAHPTLNKPGARFRFHFEEYEWGVGTIGFFGNGGEKADAEAFDEYLRRLEKGMVNGVHTDNDSHTPLDPTDKDKWVRANYVYMKDLSMEELKKAFKEGKIWATDQCVKVDSASPAPDGRVYLSDVPHFAFRFSYPPYGSDRKMVMGAKIKIYRDQKLVEGSVKEVDLATTSQDYSFDDTQAEPGYHTYVLVVDNVVVSSPIKVVVVKLT